MCLCHAELRSPLTWECHALSFSVNPFISAAFRQDMYSSSFLSPDWKLWKALLTWEAAGEGIWRREKNFSTEKFCMTSRQKIAREIRKTENETQPIWRSWKKSRNWGKNVAWVGEVVSLGISNWETPLLEKLRQKYCNLISVSQKASGRIRTKSP